ncbi:MAG: hypothetical protein NC203_08510 [Firmicutes bacterium]|nr:hypothetical protein [[Eubacterium] siraeum]MCM1488393.1 hypothetical protein [Bacillota bacterium]
MDYIYDGMAIHRYDYDLLNEIDPQNHTDDVIRWILGEVTNAAAYARNLPGLDDRITKYRKWKAAAYEYYTPKTQKERLSWGLVCAAYGYAIEEYMNRSIQDGGYPFAREFDVLVQEPCGRTIPDVRIFIHYIDPNTNEMRTEEVAWLDLTSEKSVCHIYRKRGSGWRSQPIVIEMVYPPLSAADITF